MARAHSGLLTSASGDSDAPGGSQTAGRRILSRGRQARGESATLVNSERQVTRPRRGAAESQEVGAASSVRFDIRV